MRGKVKSDSVSGEQSMRSAAVKVTLEPVSETKERTSACPECPTLSLVFPIYNEEVVLPTLFARLDDVVAELQQRVGSVEVLFVNDGSRDRSLALLKEEAEARPWARILSFSRNFGHQIAVTAGMEHARGQAVALLDADLQDPPELLPQMVDLWQQG